ncbi:helix-turn-helix transcriptional regulator [Longirhabdus pacifica]|uniref:helix-turn-helix transcriptional regulator n=1 Tax=Longirhabdus pacifica TaxID=2305227 RepID=UPI001008AC4B|nr:AraC family transcriptional regulator [Longirhabdus pacifica]
MIVIWMVDEMQEQLTTLVDESENDDIQVVHSLDEVEKQVLHVHHQYDALFIFTTKPHLEHTETLSSLMTIVPVYVVTEVDKHTQFILKFMLFYLASIKNERENDPILKEISSSTDEIDWEKTIQYIRDHLYNNDLSLEEVASQNYVSKWHFSKIFKRKFGITFREFLINERILLAKKLLLSNESVTSVCYAVGYGDLTHFGRIFQKKVGMTPSHYKKYYI